MSFLRNLFGKEVAAPGFQRKAERRIASLKTTGTGVRTGEWHDVYASKQGDAVLAGGAAIPAGEWLCFLYHFEPMPRPDDRIIVSDIACFWLKIPAQIELEGGSVYPLPDEITGSIVADGDYAEWKCAFQAIDKYLSEGEAKYQWSWRTERVKRFMSGGSSDWISTA